MSAAKNPQKATSKSALSSSDHRATAAKSLANSVREWRVSRGWTQKELAATSGVSLSLIEKIEGGKAANPKPVTVGAIERAVGCELGGLRRGLLPQPAPLASEYRNANFLESRFGELNVVNFVREHWGLEFDSVQPRNLEAGIPRELRNSRQCLLERGDQAWLLREILRKPIADPERVASKADVLNWLSASGFPTPAPLRRRAGSQWVSGQPAYEVYAFERGGQEYTERVATVATPDVAHLLARFIQQGSRIEREEPDLAELLKRRFSRCHQFGELEWSSARARDFEALLGKRAERSDIKQVIEAIDYFVDADLEAEILAEADDQPPRMIHGDFTEDNVLVFSREARLYDWDVLRMLPSGHFDLAFAMVRLGIPRKESSSHRLRADEVEAAGRLLAVVNAQMEGDPAAPTEVTVRLGLHEVALEFCLRMIEYLTLLSELPQLAVRSAYLKRCNPRRPLEMARHLFK